jgi:transcriptional regulator with XRE-family HTH domain
MATTKSKEFGEIIKQARLKSGLSLGEAASEAQISKSILRFWELGEVDSPELDNLLRLAAVLDLDATTACEAAGYDVSQTWPSIQPYLRHKYPELPAAARREIAAVAYKYGVDPDGLGPLDGQDER